MFGALALLPAAFQLGQGLWQNFEANNLEESKYIPPALRMKRQLAQTQAFSRRAPGAGQVESNIRRNLATSLSAARRNFGGDAGKMATIASAASAQANDATAREAVRGQQFSEDAYRRVGEADSEIANQQARNRMQYNQTKGELYKASGQNLFNAASNVGTFALAGGFSGIDPDIKAGGKAKIAEGKTLNRQQAGRGAGGGDPYIKEGRAMIKGARRAKWNTVGQNMMSAQNPMAYGGFDVQDYLLWKAGMGNNK